MSEMSATSAITTSPNTADLAVLGLAAGARAIRNGEITSEMYTAALLRRAQALAELNTFITIDQNAALEAARAADKARAAGSVAPAMPTAVGSSPEWESSQPMP